MTTEYDKLYRVAGRRVSTAKAFRRGLTQLVGLLRSNAHARSFLRALCVTA